MSWILPQLSIWLIASLRVLSESRGSPAATSRCEFQFETSSFGQPPNDAKAFNGFCST
jgi:hypothetical protein